MKNEGYDMIKKKIFYMVVMVAILICCSCGDKTGFIDSDRKDTEPVATDNQRKTDLQGETKKQDEMPAESINPDNLGSQEKPTSSQAGGEKQHTWIDEIRETFEQRAVSNSNMSLTIPVYDESMVLYNGEPQFFPYLRLGWDLSIYDSMTGDAPTCFQFFSQHFPNCAIRDRGDGSYYIVLDTDTGKRMFIFYDASNRLITPVGYAVVVDGNYKRKEDFDSIAVGSTISEIIAIDNLAEVYRHMYMDIYQMTPDNARNQGQYGMACRSIHYLQNGILVVYYEDMNDNGELIVTKTEYSENYKLTDYVGREVNYRIAPIDLP